MVTGSVPALIGAAMLAVLLGRHAWHCSARAATQVVVMGSRLAIREGDFECPIENTHCFGWALWLTWRNPDGMTARSMLLADSLEDPAHWRVLKAWARHRLEPVA